MAGGAASRDPHREVVKIEPALVKAQRGREVARRQGVGQVESSDLELYGGGRRAQRRAARTSRPTSALPSVPAGAVRARAPETPPSGMRSTVSWPSISARAAPAAARRQPPSRPPPRRGQISALASGTSLERLRRLKSEVAARLDPGDRRREPRKCPSIAAQGRVEPDIGGPERAAIGGRKTKGGGQRREVRRLGPGGPEQLRVVALRRGQEAAAPRELRSGELRGRVDVVALLPAAGRVERDARAAASPTLAYARQADATARPSLANRG